jgi:hypothetical protein
MVDSVGFIPAAAGPFDTATMQIVQAQAQAAFDHTNMLAFLKEIARINEETNAQALNSTTSPPVKDFLSGALLNLDPALDPSIDPSADPAVLPLFSQFGTDLKSTETSASVQAQQRHDAAILQKDAQLLEAAANDNSYTPLGSSASTLDLSVNAQNIVDGTATVYSLESLFSAERQLMNIGAMLRSVADEPLTPSLLQRIQSQLTAGQNPLQLSLNTMIVAMNFIAGMQSGGAHAARGNGMPDDKEMTVSSISSIERAAIENGAVRR